MSYFERMKVIVKRERMERVLCCWLGLGLGWGVMKVGNNSMQRVYSSSQRGMACSWLHLLCYKNQVCSLNSSLQEEPN